MDSLLRALEREKVARKSAEKILEQKSIEIYNLNQSLENSNKALGTKVNQRMEEQESIAGISDENPSPIIRMNYLGDVIYQNRD